MKIAGIVLILGGVFSLFKNMNFPSLMIWSAMAIIVGLLLKQGCNHVRCGGIGLCGMKGDRCGMSEEGNHKCEGSDCGDCKK